MKFTSKGRQNSLIEEGLHNAVITGVVETSSTRTGTPQLEVTYQTEDGKTRKAWYNLQGFKKNAAGQFVDKKGMPVIIEQGDTGNVLEAKLKKRIVDEDATQKCLDIVGQLGADAGIDTSEEFGPEDLIDRTVLIAVKGNNIAYVFSQSRSEYAMTFCEGKGIPVDRTALVTF